MNKEIFINELKNYDECPADFLQIYAEFNKYQLIAIEILRELHRICENNKIRYQLAFGSLLGAVRDKGQIPWDYDIDVFVPYFQKEMLISSLESNLDKRYYYYCPENNSECRHVILRVAPKGYRADVLHVDVFYYIGTPNSVEDRKELEQRIKYLAKSRIGKLTSPIRDSAGNFRKFLSLLIKYKVPTLFMSTSKIQQEYNSLCSRYPIEQSDICIEADRFADCYEIPTQLLSDTVIVHTDIGEVRISAHSDELLQIFYGDYMKVPPISQRVQEVINHYNKLKYYDRK